jgi:MFS family permease
MRLLDRLGRRPMVIVAGWLVAAALAVLVGVLGIGVVGAGLTSRQGVTISERDVEIALDSSSPSAAPSGAPSPSPTERAGEPASSVRSFVTAGGTVLASCARIETMSPAQGFALHEQDDHEGEFRGIRDDHDRVKVELSCSGGVPQLRVRTEGR